MPFAFRSAPDVRQRLDLLGSGARFEACGPVYRGGPEAVQEGPIYLATMRGGRSIPLLKVLLTDRCVGGCRYCAFRASRDVCRTTLTPEELARTFDSMLRRDLVRGLFLSSGIDPDPVTSMDRLLDAAALVRRSFPGYVHLKILPGTEPAQLERAAALASRLSVNLEAPSRERLRALAPGKSRPALLRDQLDRVAELTRRGRAPASGWTTQYVVGPAGEGDRELLATSGSLYRGWGLTRAYYARFEPVVDTPLQDHAPTPQVRQNRLYQADTLIREYGFHEDELPFDDGGDLDRETDPKTAWARAHPELFPLEINRAERSRLLRVPGFGPTSVSRILRVRREGRIRSVDTLRRLGVPLRRCRGYVILDGRLYGHEGASPDQLDLFSGP